MYWEHQWQACPHICYLDFTRRAEQVGFIWTFYYNATEGCFVQLTHIYHHYKENKVLYEQQAGYQSQIWPKMSKACPVTVVSSWGTQPGGDEGNQNPSESPQSPAAQREEDKSDETKKRNTTGARGEWSS